MANTLKALLDAIRTSKHVPQGEVWMFRDPKPGDEDDLTEDEKFAICVWAGCKTDLQMQPNGSIKLTTRNPCAVKVQNGRYVVYEKVGANG